MTQNKETPKTWDMDKRDFVETPRHMQAFFNEIDNVCKRYGLSISHEDWNGGFIIEMYSERNMEWLRSASKNY